MYDQSPERRGEDLTANAPQYGLFDSSRGSSSIELLVAAWQSPPQDTKTIVSENLFRTSETKQTKDPEQRESIPPRKDSSVNVPLLALPRTSSATESSSTTPKSENNKHQQITPDQKTLSAGTKDIANPFSGLSGGLQLSAEQLIAQQGRRPGVPVVPVAPIVVPGAGANDKETRAETRNAPRSETRDLQATPAITPELFIAGRGKQRLAILPGSVARPGA